MLRGHAGRPEWVLVTETVGSSPRRRRTRRAEGEPPAAEVVVGRATLIAADPIEEDAGRWLAAADTEAQAAQAAAVINRVLHLHRIAAAETHARTIDPEEAIAVRVGFGNGEQVARGRWVRAVDVGTGRGRRRRRRMLQPDERFAALVGGYDVPLASEELCLRARSDVEAGRWREAALQLDAAFAVAPQELAPWRNHSDMSARIAELQELSPAVSSAAEAALQGGLSQNQSEAVTGALERLEAALRARTAAALP